MGDFEKLLGDIRQLQEAGLIPKEPTHEQRVSWAYGNAALSNPNVTREMVERQARLNPPRGVRYSCDVPVKILPPVPFAAAGRRGAWRLADISTTLDPRPRPPWREIAIGVLLTIGVVLLAVR